MEVVDSIQFGVKGNSDQYFAAGYSKGEDGFSWSLDDSSSVEFPPPNRSGSYSIRVEGFGYAPGARLPAQKLRVYVNGRRVGEARISAPFEIEWAAPTETLVDGKPIMVEFEHPDAARPCDFSDSPDTRRIAIAFHKVALILREEDIRSSTASVEPSDRELAVLFESLGGDCEFGFVQRALGSEPLGLLRFAGMAAKDLATLLRTGLDELGTDENLSVHEQDGQVWAWDSRFCFGSHIFGPYDPHDLEALRKRETKRIGLLSKKLKRDLAEGTKIFVFKSRDDADDAEMESLHEALRSYGSHHLLWVNRCGGDRPRATLEQLGANLFRGWVAPPSGKLEETTNLADWIWLCRAAWKRRQIAPRGGEDAERGE